MRTCAANIMLIAQYAKDARLPQMMNRTQIHQVAVVYRGSDLARIREATE